ncbi:Ribosomal protein S3Ae isoform 1 [Hibiscus syriacus]|uniref:Ribosomal protein S3Ae isoform 1 n=1 Tax=Hibiscus syriacus TaxID=106335 RepID=A0A6A2XIQ4_HIBSY|nr:Ribosomal protein S3Ae isoform 1 [Hibiscus syriacus]
MLDMQIERAESEVEALKDALAKLKEEKDTVARWYEQCLETIARLEGELSCAQEESKRLNSEILVNAEKLRGVEEQRVLLEKSNQSLLAEADSLVQEIATKDRELLEKQHELEKLQTSLKEEHLRFVQVEATMETLQKLNSQSQEQRVLTSELLNKLQIEGVGIQIERSNILQQEVEKLKDEIEVLNSAYQALIQKLMSVGLNPECLESSLKELRHDNSKLKEECSKQRGETEVLNEKLRSMDDLVEKNVVLRSSLLELNGKLEGSRELVEKLQKSHEFLRGEKSSLDTEKSTLLSQLQKMTVQKLLEKNAMLESSLSCANIELEGLRSKSKTLEEFCQYLKNEKSNLAGERDSLILKLETVEKRLCILEFRFDKLEEKYSDLEKEKVSTLSQVEQLQDSLGVEQKERASYVQLSKSRLTDRENHAIYCKKKELESENLEQQIEGEFLLDEIEKLRSGIYLVFRALQFDPVNGQHDMTESDQVPFSCLLGNVEDLKISLLRNQEEKQQLVVENSVLLTLIRQPKFEGSELVLENRALEYKFDIAEKQNAMLQKDKKELLEMNQQLMLEVRDGTMEKEILNAELESQRGELESMHGTCLLLEEENSKQLEENRFLLEKFSDLKEDMLILEDENSIALQEAVALNSLSLVLETFGAEKAVEIAKLEEKLEKKEAEISELKETVEKLHKELYAVKDLNEGLNHQIVINNDLLRGKTIELSEADGKLQVAHESNEELYRTLEKLKRECEESKQIRENLEKRIYELSEDSEEQKMEIEHHSEENDDLGSEVVTLRNEIEEQRMYGENLSLELQERNNEFELWEAEAASFYFDFQASAICDVLLENKVHELTEVCGTLEEENAVKSAQIGQMKKRVEFLESEIGGLKVQISAYGPVIASLRDGITSLEHNALIQPKLSVPSDDEDKGVEVAAALHGMSSEELEEGQKRRKAWVMSLLGISSQRKKIPETRNGILLKDIPLDQVSNSSLYRSKSKIETAGTADDQMLKLWESAEHECDVDLKMNDMQERAIVPGEIIASHQLNDVESKTDCSLGTLVEKELSIDKLEISTSIREPKKRAKSKRFLDRLASDAHKLTTLQTNVKQLKKRMEITAEKRMEIKKRKKDFELEYGQVKEQLQELEEPGNGDLKKVREQAQNGSEKIKRLQFEVQSIEYVMLKLEDERKSKGKNRTGVLLRDFIYSGGRRSGRRKKACFCVCKAFW